MVDLGTVGVAVVFVGFLLILLSVLFSVSKTKGERTRIRGGGVVMIGPIPIIFGSDAKWTAVSIVLALILILVSLILYRNMITL